MNKTQTKDYIRKNIIDKYPLLKDLSDGDLKFMIEVLLGHQYAFEKSEFKFVKDGRGIS